MTVYANYKSHTSYAGLRGARRLPLLLAAVLLCSVLHSVFARPEGLCVRLDSGWVRGVKRSSHNQSFVSFLGVPYARQPVGHLRFQELQPVEPWDDVFDAIQEGPICPQNDVFYGSIMQPRNTTFTEACIHANIHVPLNGLPGPHQARELRPPYSIKDDQRNKRRALPIFVFIHGGGFGYGSGDTDLYGPEYLVPEGVIVITFNYRLNVFGFLSLNNSFIPGNNGLRDMVTLLRWVRVNARHFGGNPDDVTIGGHSAGAACAHLLTLSPATKGLFKRTILMSGTAIPTFYAPTPTFAQIMSKRFLQEVGITSTDPEEVHQQLIEMPLENLIQANRILQDKSGLTLFYPVVETHPYKNFTTILDDYPEALLIKGFGKHIPLIIGFTDAEAYGFLPRLKQMDIVNLVKENPIILTPPNLYYTRSPEVAMKIAKTVKDRYFHGEPTMDQYVKYLSESFFVYSALKASRIRAAVGGAPVYLYEFSYQSEFSIKKEVDNVQYKGAGHLDDVTYIFRVNSILGPEGTFKRPKNDEDMKNWMVHIMINFIKHSDPAAGDQPRFASPWPSVTKRDTKYKSINVPPYRVLPLNTQQMDILRFYDSLQDITS